MVARLQGRGLGRCDAQPREPAPLLSLHTPLSRRPGGAPAGSPGSGPRRRRGFGRHVVGSRLGTWSPRRVSLSGTRARFRQNAVAGGRGLQAGKGLAPLGGGEEGEQPGLGKEPPTAAPGSTGAGSWRRDLPGPACWDRAHLVGLRPPSCCCRPGPGGEAGTGPALPPRPHHCAPDHVTVRSAPKVRVGPHRPRTCLAEPVCLQACRCERQHGRGPERT